MDISNFDQLRIIAGPFQFVRVLEQDSYPFAIPGGGRMEQHKLIARLHELGYKPTYKQVSVIRRISDKDGLGQVKITNKKPLKMG